ncbi:MAG: ISL3 family transposase [Patescibacteria group bacterium]|nr:ISL3 family transposase [Patescibacteria group bacterium]
MKKDIMNWFSLRGVILDAVEVKDRILLKVRCPRTWCMCPKCTKSSRNFHDSSVRYKLHCLSGEKRVYIACTVRRFYCRKCNKPFTEPLPPWMNGRYRYTKPLEELVSGELATSNFFEVSRKYGISAHTLLAILKRRAREVEIPDGELILNVDEHSYRGRDLKIGVAAANKKRFLAILPDDNQITLEKYFKSWPNEAKSRVREVCIDMKHSYLSVLKEELPHAKVVVDHFHVVREMSRQLEETRKVIQEMGKRGERRINRFLLAKNAEDLSVREKRALARVFKAYRKFPTLQGAYFVKEKVREMYRCKTRVEAERKLDMLLSQLEHHEVGKLAEMRNTLTRWKPYILNFFERRTTNAFIEGCHNKIKLVKRMSYGFRNFNNYVLKITLAMLPFFFLNFPH